MRIQLLFLLIISMFCDFSTLYGQTIDLGCQSHEDAFIGLDRKNWNGGSTSNHSEGLFLNFQLPDEEGCKKIQNVDIELTVFLVDDSALNGDCGAIAYFVNIYSGCGDFAPASCSTENLVAEPNAANLNSQNFSFDANDFDFQFGDTLGIDIVPALGNVGCPNGQSAISSGDIIIEYDICVEVTLIDEDMITPLELGEDIVVCQGETTSLSSNAEYASYLWSPTGETTPEVVVGAGVYLLEVTDVNGCMDVDSIEVTEAFPELEIIAADDNNIICEGTTIELEVITNELDTEWSTGDTTHIIEVGAGSYSVTVTDINGCTNSDVIEIESSVAEISISSSDDNNQVCTGATLVLEANAEAGTIEWNTGETGNQIEVGPGVYTATYTNQEGCVAEDMITISELEGIETSLETSICEGESVIINGTEYDLAGTYTQEFTTQEGCDSIVTIMITPEFGCDDCNARPSDEIIISTHKGKDNFYTITIEDKAIRLHEDQLSTFIHVAQEMVQRNDKNKFTMLLESNDMAEFLHNNYSDQSQVLPNSYQFIKEARSGARLDLSFKFH